MDKQEFLDLVCRFEEIMMQRDHLRSQIGLCGEGCDDEDEGLCPECGEIFRMVQDEDKQLNNTEEFHEVLAALKEACKADKSGEYEMIFRKFRGEGSAH